LTRRLRVDMEGWDCQGWRKGPRNLGDIYRLKAALRRGQE
jgi:hypothetical protein